MLCEVIPKLYLGLQYQHCNVLFEWLFSEIPNSKNQFGIRNFMFSVSLVLAFKSKQGKLCVSYSMPDLADSQKIFFFPIIINLPWSWHYRILTVHTQSLTASYLTIDYTKTLVYSLWNHYPISPATPKTTPKIRQSFRLGVCSIIVFWQLCKRFDPNVENVMLRYVHEIRLKYTAKWGK